ncbi:DUF6090 family protein [Tamlana flava]|uniref:DUF6090 family protein n=1 Tax=Tamlana flava TaxID=3158572 RepID=UPI00351BC8A0
MINFFRKIRQNLLFESKTGKYLKYSLGEIVLVVIGILIALQINTWNENQKHIKKEHTFLVEVLKSLKRDLGRTKFIYNNRALTKRNDISTIIKDLNQIPLPADSILRNSFEQMTMTLSFIYDKGAYESLKSYGIDLIRDNSLRQNIVRMYENDLPLGIIFIDADRDVQEEMRYKLTNEIFTFREETLNKNSEIGVPHIDYNSLKNNRAFNQLVYLEKDVANNYVRRLEDKISDFEELILSIQNELNKSK